MLLLSDETNQFLHNCDITNNKEAASSLYFIMTNEILIHKRMTQCYYTIVFTIMVSLGLLLFKQKDQIFIFGFALTTAFFYTFIQFTLAFNGKLKIKKYNKKSIYNDFFKNVIIHYADSRCFEKIIMDISINNLMNEDDIKDIQYTYHSNNLQIKDIKKIHNVFLTAKLKSTLLPSTTISLHEHKKEVVKYTY